LLENGNFDYDPNPYNGDLSRLSSTKSFHLFGWILLFLFYAVLSGVFENNPILDLIPSLIIGSSNAVCSILLGDIYYENSLILYLPLFYKTLDPSTLSLFSILNVSILSKFIFSYAF
jgi:hypothetical protein